MSADEDSSAVEVPRDAVSASSDLQRGRNEASFATTRWSLVRAAGIANDSAGRQALASLCETYWYPLYVYVRGRGLQPAEAQDLTQAFFASLLEGNLLGVANQERGRFRAFLLQSLQNFLSVERRRKSTLKRGGGRPMLSLDLAASEDRYRHEPVDELTPERLFERRWALTLLETALSRLQEEYESTGRSALFVALEPHLQGHADALPYAELTSRLQMSEGAIKVAAHRLRRRYRELLRDQIAETVSLPEEVDEELRALLQALS